MKIAHRADADNVVEGLAVRQMALDANKQRKLFTILSDGLYKNAAMSMIRELSSNAHDSHLMAGRPDHEIEYTAPTYELSQFSVRDYGVGLTADEAYDTILNFLGSNKDDSDDYIGGWGLGSKSPFAFAETYEVTCYKHGHYWTFTCYHDDSGLPMTALTDQGDTDQATGVRVTVPVHADQLYQFRYELASYLSNTNYAVRLTNPDDLAGWTPLTIHADIVVDGIRYSFVPGRRGVAVWYGGFVYDINDLTSWDSSSQPIRNNWHDVLHNYGLMIHANVGDCDFQVSRETMKGTNRTHTWILVALHHLQQYLDGMAREYYHAVLGPISQLKPESVDDLFDQQATLQALAPSPDNPFNWLDWHSYAKQLLVANDWLDHGCLNNGDWHVMLAPLQLNGVSGRVRVIDWKYHRSRRLVSLTDCDDQLQISLRQPIAAQATAIWTPKFIQPSRIDRFYTVPVDHTYLMLRATDEADARALMATIGLARLPLVPLSEAPFQVAPEPPPKSRGRHGGRPINMYDAYDHKVVCKYDANDQYVLVPPHQWGHFTNNPSAYRFALSHYAGIAAVIRASTTSSSNLVGYPNMHMLDDPRLRRTILGSALLHDLSRHFRQQLQYRYMVVIKNSLPNNRHLQRLLLTALDAAALLERHPPRATIFRADMLIEYCKAARINMYTRCYWASPHWRSPDQLAALIDRLQKQSPVAGAIHWERYHRLPRPLRLSIRAAIAAAIEETLSCNI